MDSLKNASVVGRLLEEISWEGPNVRAYRDGGRGRENVLTAEVLMPLAYLPSEAFLAEVLRGAHGADHARSLAASEMERADITLLPEESKLGATQIVVQPDATFVTPNTMTLVEAKRMRPSSFQLEQLAREYLVLLREADGRTPLMLLLLGTPPPVTVESKGRLELTEAVMSPMGPLLARIGEPADQVDELEARLPDVIAWITWHELRDIVLAQAVAFEGAPNGLAGTVRRLSEAVTSAIAWHGPEADR